MATAMYLEHYLDSLESLPGELQRNFSLMRDLDQKAQDLMKEIDGKAEEYLLGVRAMSPEKRTEFLGVIQKLFSKSREFGDDKVQLAMQTYEMVDRYIQKYDKDIARMEKDLQETLSSEDENKENVSKSLLKASAEENEMRMSKYKLNHGKVDKHIRKLDADLARFEADLKDKSLGKPKTDERPETGKKSSQKEKDKKKRKSMKDEFEDEIPRKKKKKGQKEDEPPVVTPVISPLLSLTMNNPSDVLDMPVDPNEPTYCLCHQVSYGEMIGCDNLDCPIEWFHFGCVGLTAKPKGKWFCPRCSEERKKVKDK